MKENLSEKTLETKKDDTILFLEILPLFEKMSLRGKYATIESLVSFLVKEE